MEFDDLITPDSVLCNVSARSKKHSLEIMSELLTNAFADVAAEEVFARLIERERLGCTCLDRGIAFPRCRIEGLEDSTAALMRLAEPVDFDSPDGEPVDLLFGMLVPEELSADDHREIERLSRLLKDPALCERLRAASSSSELHETLMAGIAAPPAELRQAQQG